MRRPTLVVVSACIALISASSWAQSNVKRERMARISQLLAEPDGLHKAAVYNGGYFRQSVERHGLVAYRDLASLAGASDAVLVGQILENKCMLSSNGQYVVTEYSVRAEEVLQGVVRPGSVLKIRMPGGRFTFPDGVTVEEDHASVRGMMDGRRYLLYIKYVAAEQSYYPPAIDGQGVFELHPDGRTVISHANRRIDPLAAKSEVQQADLLKEARETTKDKGK